MGGCEWADVVDPVHRQSLEQVARALSVQVLDEAVDAHIREIGGEIEDLWCEVVSPEHQKWPSHAERVLSGGPRCDSAPGFPTLAAVRAGDRSERSDRHEC